MAIKVLDTNGIERILPEISEVGERIQAKVREESDRATSAEHTITIAIETEQTRATAAENSIRSDLQIEIHRATSAESGLSARISQIEGKIPLDASIENLLADRDWVGAQISQITAYYRGSFETKAALDAWQLQNPGVANNADYAYVQADETHNGETWRYIFVKESGQEGSWQPQYKVSNASFTSTQMAAIDSGATKEKIDSIANKVDRLVISDLTKVYASEANTGNTIAIEASSSVKPLVIVQRDDNGNVKTGIPISDNDSATKLYVDELDSRISIRLSSVEEAIADPKLIVATI